MKKKTLLRIVSYLLTIAIVMTSSSITTFAESLDDVSANEIVKEATETAEEISTVSENEGEKPADISGDDEEIVIPGEEETTPGEEIIPEEEEIPDVSDNDEIIEDISAGEESRYNGNFVGTITAKIGNKTTTYKDDEILTLLNGSEFRNAQNVLITLKSNIVLDNYLLLNSKNNGKITLDLGRFNITTDETVTNVPAIKLMGTTQLTIKGSGTISSKNQSTSAGLKGTINISPGTSLTLMGGKVSIGGESPLTYNYSAISLTGYQTACYIKGGTVESNYWGIYAGDNSKVEISGGTVKGVSNALRLEGTDAVATIKGGTLSVKRDGTISCCAVYLAKGTLNITGGTILAEGYGAFGVEVDNQGAKKKNAAAYISGGTIKAIGENSACGIMLLGTPIEVYQTGGNVTVQAANVATGFYASQVVSESVEAVYISGGTYNVKATSENGVAYGVHLVGATVANKETVSISGNVSFTVDAAVTVGAAVIGGNVELDLAGGKFILGSSKADSKDKKVYGVIVDNNTLDIDSANISINSAANEIYGIVSNSLNNCEINALNIVIMASKADRVSGIYIRHDAENVYSLSDGTEDLKLRTSDNPVNSTLKCIDITVSGNIKEATGVLTERKRNSTGTSVDQLRIINSKLKVSSDSTNIKELYGIRAVNDDSVNSGLSLWWIENVDINVATTKKAASSEATVAGVATENLLVHGYGGIKVADSKINVSVGDNVNSKAYGITASSCNFSEEYGSKVYIVNNSINVSAAKSKWTEGIQISRKLGSEVIAGTSLNVEILDNTISAYGGQNLSCGVEVEGVDNVNFSGNTVTASGRYYTYGIIGKFNGGSNSFLNSSIRAVRFKSDISGYAECAAVSLYTKDNTGKDTFENCSLSVNTAYVSGREVYAAKIETAREVSFEDCDITKKSNDTKDAALLITSKRATITDTKINSTGSGMDLNTTNAVTISNCSVKSQDYCIDLDRLSSAITVYFAPDSVLECTGTGNVVRDSFKASLVLSNSGTGIGIYAKDGNEITDISQLVSAQYAQIRDNYAVAAEIEIRGVDGSALLSKNGELYGKLTLPEGFTLINSTYTWKINGTAITGNAFETLSGSTSQFGNPGTESNVEMSVKIIMQSPSGNYYTRDVKAQKSVTLNPEVTLWSNTLCVSSGTARFSDGSYYKKMPVYYGSLLTANDTPTWAGYVFTGWYTSALYGNESITEDTTFTPNYVPDGFYVRAYSIDSTGKEVLGDIIATVNSDGKSVQLPDMYYTGFAIKPKNYKVFYGDVELSDSSNSATSLNIVQKKGAIKTSYKNNTNVGEATITIKSNNKNYKGTITLKFNILATGIYVESSEQSIKTTYTGKAIKFNPTVRSAKDKNLILRNGKDYSVTCYYESGSDRQKVKEIKKAGTYQIESIGKGGYNGTVITFLTVTNDVTKLTANMVEVDDIAYEALSSYDKTYLPGSGTYASKLRVNKNGIAVSSSAYTLEYRVKGKGSFVSASAASKDSFSTIGTFEVKVTGKPDNGLEGTVTKVYKITGTDISKWTLTFTSDITKLVYRPRTPYEKVIKVDKLVDKAGNNYNVVNGTDYDISFTIGKNTYTGTNYIHAGKVTVTVTGRGKYYGTIRKTVTIQKFDIGAAYRINGEKKTAGKISLVMDDYALYSPDGAKTSVSLYYGNGDLAYTIDKTYSVSYKNNKKIGMATVVIKGNGDLTGTIKADFKVVSSALSDADIEVTDRTASKKAGDYATKISLKHNGKTLKEGKDYEKPIYKDEKGNILDKNSRVTAGQKVSVVIIGKGNYNGLIMDEFSVTRTAISSTKAKIKDQVLVESSYWNSYTSMSKIDVRPTTRDITITHKSYGTLKYGEDFVIVGYTNNTKAGTAYVTIQGIGNYTGTMKVKFNIKQSDISKKATKSNY